MTRRQLLAGAALAAPLVIPGRVFGKDGAVAASERITLAGLGIGSRGGYVLGCMMDEPVFQFVAIADPQKSRRESVKQRTEKKYGPGVAMYRDFREMLPRQDIDAVLIATGDRWHTMASILAAKAGKDVYSEKPCGITIDVCRALADTIQKTKRVFQAGTQRRAHCPPEEARSAVRNVLAFPARPLQVARQLKTPIALTTKLSLVEGQLSRIKSKGSFLPPLLFSHD